MFGRIGDIYEKCPGCGGKERQENIIFYFLVFCVPVYRDPFISGAALRAEIPDEMVHGAKRADPTAEKSSQD
jgi:hypothetical protein